MTLKGKDMRMFNILIAVLMSVGFFAFPPHPAGADYLVVKGYDVTKPARKELKRLLKEGTREDWEKRLSPAFMTGFGGQGLDKMKEEFLQRIVEDQAYRDEFLNILGMRCAYYYGDSWACPGKWVNCPEGDFFCGTQTRILIDIEKKDWKLGFYGSGD